MFISTRTPSSTRPRIARHISPRAAVRRIAASRLISLTGSEAAYIALMFTIYRRTGSAAWLSAALLLTFGVSGLLGPIAGILGDRLDRRRLMIASDLAGVGCFAALAFARSPASLLAIAFVAALVEAPFYPASSAAIPNLATPELLTWANGTVSMGRNFGQLVGPVIGGILVAAIGAPGVFGLDAISFAVSAALVWSVRGRSFSEGPDESATSPRGALAGFSFLAREPALRTMTIAWVVLILGVGGVLVAELPLSAHFGAGALGYSLIGAGWGAGAVAGSLIGRRLLSERSEPWALLAGAGLMAAAFGAVAASPWFAPVIGAMMLGGLGNGASGVAELGVMQRRTPDSLRSRVMAASDGAVMTAFAASFAFAGALVAALGPKGVYAVAAFGCALGGLILIPAVRALRASPQ